MPSCLSVLMPSIIALSLISLTVACRMISSLIRLLQAIPQRYRSCPVTGARTIVASAACPYCFYTAVKLLQNVFRDVLFDLAVLAYSPDKPLGNHADQCGGNEIVSIPMSISLVMAPGASFVWRVLKSRWPVRAAWIEIPAVSMSRISPTIITSGSCLTICLRPLAKVSPIFGLTCIWVMPA